MNYRDIKCIALDMIGVLVREEKLISHGMPAYFGSRLKLPVETIKQRYDEGYCVGALSREAFWEGVLNEDWHQAERDFLVSRKFNDEASRVVQDLQGIYRLSVISDMPREWATVILQAHGLLPALELGVFSNDGVGSKKDGRLFDALIKRVDHRSNEILLVDDHLKNLQIARNKGVGGVLMPLDETLDDTQSFSVIRELSELQALLKA